MSSEEVTSHLISRHTIVMKSIVTIICILFFSVGSGLLAQDAHGSLVEWDTQKIDLGHIVQGKKISNSYTFTNISTENVEIDIVSTCECTEAKWTQGTIAPGETGTVEFIFDSAQKDVVEPIDVDVYFLNINPKTERPYSSFLSYTFAFIQ